MTQFINKSSQTIPIHRAYLVQYSSWSTGKTVDLQSINLREPSEFRLYKAAISHFRYGVVDSPSLTGAIVNVC